MSDPGLAAQLQQAVATMSGWEAAAVVLGIAYLLLELFYRCHDRCAINGDLLEMPLTQDEIGDTLGLTNVHVSRTLAEIHRRGLIDRHGHQIHFRDLATLGHLASFEPHMVEPKPLF